MGKKRYTPDEMARFIKNFGNAIVSGSTLGFKVENNGGKNRFLLMLKNKEDDAFPIIIQPNFTDNISFPKLNLMVEVMNPMLMLRRIEFISLDVLVSLCKLDMQSVCEYMFTVIKSHINQSMKECYSEDKKFYITRYENYFDSHHLTQGFSSLDELIVYVDMHSI